MPDQLSITEFLNIPDPLLDVRSPGEYAQGHLPGAISFPLFSDKERAQVGICYKQQGRDAAVELGLAIVGPKLGQFVAEAKSLAPDRRLRLYCWRGGMRSGSMAWLLETAGLQVALLKDGYKAFRRWVLETIALPRPIANLGGMTGSGKTLLLQELGRQGEQILDLEALAHHRGSSYGNLGLPPQPSTEQFENQIAMAWSSFNPERWVWIEAESRQVGTCRIPVALFQQMTTAPVIQVERSRQERVALLLEVYGQVDRAELIAATERLRKRLGGQRTQEAIAWIQQGNLAPAIEIVLDYYDKTYLYDLQRRQVPIHSVDLTGLPTSQAIQRLMHAAKAMVALPTPDLTKVPTRV